MPKSIPQSVVLKMIKDHQDGMSCRSLEKKYGYERHLISKTLKDSGEKTNFRYSDPLLQRASTLFQEGKSLRQISKLLNVDQNQLARQLERLGVRNIEKPKNAKREFKESEITQQIKEAYLNGRSIHGIAKDMNCSSNVPYRVLREYGIIDSERLAKTYELVDENIFEQIDTEQKAYWLGFLMADCYMNDLNGKCAVEFMLAEKDRERVESFVRFINSKAPLPIQNRIINGHGTVRVCIHNKKVFQDLTSWGCVPRKSLTKVFPWAIPHVMYRHFIRGYFDGNGSISQSKGKFQFFITSSERMCKGIENLLIKEGIIYRRCKMRRSGEAWDFRRNGNTQVQRIFHYLYDEATEYMQRKYVNFSAVLSEAHNIA